MNYGMFIIRPDGNNEKFYNRFLWYLLVEHIDIIEEKEVVFSKEDVGKYFYYQFPKYVEYMTSGKSRCVFVGAQRNDLDAKILEIKETLREEFGVDKRCLKSLIHSSQAGTEFFLQKRIFGEKFYSSEYVVGKDYDIKIPSLVYVPELITYLDRSQISSAIINVKPDELKAFGKTIKSNRPNKTLIGVSTSTYLQMDGCQYELIWFIRSDAIYQENFALGNEYDNLKEISYSVGLGTVNFKQKQGIVVANSKEEYIEKVSIKYMSIFSTILNLEKIQSIKMDSPSFSLEEMEFRGDIANEIGIEVFGGSSDSSLIGKFAYNYCYKDLCELRLQEIM